MKEATEANISDAVSSKIEKPDAGSESYKNKGETDSSSGSDNQGRNFELMDSLYFAAANGIISKFEEHSKQLDQILTPKGHTILHIHITARRRPRPRISQNMAFVRYILEKCPQLLWKANEKGETLLHMAAKHGHSDVVEFLLQEIWEKNYQNHHDQELGINRTATWQMLQMINEAKDTALHEAVRYNHLDVVQLLTKEDPSLPYDVNKSGETPLYLAAERGYVEILKEILSTCISPADHGPYSRTALHTAVICNNTNKSAAYKADIEGKTPLHVAFGLGRVGIMRELISRCPSCCELVDNRGWNVFHFASTSKNRKAVELILRYPSLGNLLNEKDEKGNTPFLQAASMQFIITNPKVDLLVFNNDNNNAADIVNPYVFHLKLLNYILWSRISVRIKRCRRILFKDDDEEGRENKGDLLSSKSNTGLGQNHLVVATLIATVAFATGITVPGGLIVEKGPDQGAPILTRNTAFRAFVILNAISMFWSSYAILAHLTRRRTTNREKIIKRRMLLQGFIGYAMLAMIGAFLAGTCAVLLHSDKKLAISACVAPVAVVVFAQIVRKKANE
ncbi:hypothetical protein LWI29_023266 [Acer saccharum]|uniref:PGG domain-containing protein n=1 Tax=Acer saccharum TaxID=4024 RepID=A0AA39TDP1_ACESA|nr:hypothetical protein LWI29_023266 [Acer saccharum]